MDFTGGGDKPTRSARGWKVRTPVVGFFVRLVSKALQLTKAWSIRALDGQKQTRNHHLSKMAHHVCI
jgi:hypothetical protein